MKIVRPLIDDSLRTSIISKPNKLIEHFLTLSIVKFYPLLLLIDLKV